VSTKAQIELKKAIANKSALTAGGNSTQDVPVSGEEVPIVPVVDTEGSGVVETPTVPTEA
jgi:hypothetical protein